MSHRFVIAALAVSAGLSQPRESLGERSIPAAAGLPAGPALILVLRLCEVSRLGQGRSIRTIWEGRCACPMVWSAGFAPRDFAMGWLFSLSGMARAWSQS